MDDDLAERRCDRCGLGSMLPVTLEGGTVVVKCSNCHQVGLT